VGDSAAANHNLGTLLMRCQRHDEAVVAYRQALRYRPNYVPTYHQYLAHVLKESGRLAEAAAVWEQATAAGRASESGASQR
jgi:cytochrome c-type biogenesis protein CcmH/NrfG